MICVAQGIFRAVKQTIFSWGSSETWLKPEFFLPSLPLCGKILPKWSQQRERILEKVRTPELHGIHWVPASGCFWSWICISHPLRFFKPTNILFTFKPIWTDFLLSCNHESHTEDAFLGFILFLLLLTPWWYDKHLLTLQESVLGNSLVQWLGLRAFTVVAQVQSLIPQAMWHGQPLPPKPDSLLAPPFYEQF